MVGVNSFVHQLGAVAIVAAFCVAIQLHNDKGFLMDSERPYDFELECDGVKSSWTVSEDPKDSPGKKVLILPPEQDGCFKSRNSVALNSTTPVLFTFFREAPKGESGKFAMRLVPRTGSCPDDECVWEIVNDPQYKSGEWVTLGHKFPLKYVKDCYVEVQVEKNKGKFLVDKISVPTTADLRIVPAAGVQDVELLDYNLPEQLIPVAGNSSGGGSSSGGSSSGGSTTSTSTTSTKPPSTSSTDITEISKNLLLTTASLLTLNVVLN